MNRFWLFRIKWVLFVALFAVLVCNHGVAQFIPEAASLERHGAAARCDVAPFVLDGYTALADQYEGSTSARVIGAVSYGRSVRGLGKSLELSEGASLEYVMKGWYSWSSDYSPDGKSGAIEMWIKPAFGKEGDFLMINWNDSSTPSSAGYITHLGLDAQDRLMIGGWTSINNNPFDTDLETPHTILPAGRWAHIAYTWSPNGTAVYVNGEPEAVSQLNYYPALSDTVYVYVNPFGSDVVKAIDELRISTIARASLMSCAD